MRRRAFTLMEMMVSLALLAVILAISYGILDSTLSAEEAARRQMAYSQVADGVAALLETDLGNVLLPEPKQEATGPKDEKSKEDAVDAPILTRDSTGLVELGFTVRRQPGARVLTERQGPAEVRYQLRREAEMLRLVRRARDEETVATGLSRLDLERFAGGRWQSWELDPDDPEAALPSALRVVIGFEDGPQLTRTVFLARSLKL